MTRVLVVDDQDLIRAGLAAILRATPGFTSVWETADGETAVTLAMEHRPDVILMDIRLPGINGITTTERILAQYTSPTPKIIVLTTFDTDEYVYGALRAGACGFLLKDIPPARLIAAISAIRSGDMLFAPSVTRRLIEAYAPQPSETAHRPESLHQLTARETEVLRLVGQGLANDEIAQELYVSEATVKTHINRTMAKLDLRSRAQAVVTAYETGLVVPRGTRGTR